ncbi:MAG: sigma 54-interacting transcriptional regulator [Firmicutes bacterium]|nr:sigma 54-interacting transcriptional regulator [Bacillota bacterium]
MDIAGQQTDFYFTAMPIATGGGKQRFLLLEKKEQINRQKPLHQSNELIQFSDIIGESRLLIAAKNTARRIADAQEPVLIVGESGTGKELFAQAIHRASPRRNGKFVPINCGAIPSELAESELFGYEAGAFTGALRNGKQGLLESASDGTIFLDEIESMPLFIQVKLLRAISTGSIVKVGSTKEMPINIRVISATKKDLLKEADLGTFREDLYYRISTFIIDLPPLQKRDDDVILLAKHFIKRCQEKYNKYPLTVDDDFWHALASYDWRGNIRELENVIGRVVYMADTEKLTIVTLPREVRESFTRASSGEVQYQAQVDGLLQTGEEKIIEAALLDTNYNISQASQLLGISRKTLYNRINNSERLTQLKSVHTKKTVAKKNCL